MALSQGKMIAVLLLAGLLQSAIAAKYIVGDSTEWTYPPTATFYDDWAKNHTFYVGDELVFNYIAPVHDVWEVSEADVASCSTASPIQEWTESDVTVTLQTAGYHGYICSITGHCENNMKMNLQVLDAESPLPSASSPPPASDGGSSAACTLQSSSALFFGTLAAGCLAILL